MTNVDWIAERIEGNPELAESFSVIVEALDEGTLSLAQVGGFTDDELDAAHACACRHLSMNEPYEALAVVSTLLLLDPNRPELHRTAGIAHQQAGRWAEADRCFQLADRLEPNDPVTLMYWGETRVMAGDTEVGAALLARGIEKSSDVALGPYIARARRILKLAETH